MSLAFLKSGKEVHEETDRAALARQASWGPRRFWLDKGEKDVAITFIDGHLEDGLLTGMVGFYEHLVEKGAGRRGYDNYPCTQDTEACPLCEMPHNTPTLCYAFTIIDHRQYKDKNDKVHQHQKKLYVCKGETFKLLQLKAVKHNGLAGVTFDVSRLGEKSANVGTVYDFNMKSELASVYEQCGIKTEDQGPFDYAEAIKYFDATELRKMGFGIGGHEAKPIGSADTAALSQGTQTTQAIKPSPFAAKSPFAPGKEF